LGINVKHYFFPNRTPETPANSRNAAIHVSSVRGIFNTGNRVLRDQIVAIGPTITIRMTNKRISRIDPAFMIIFL
jgi:hypothetical protein